MQKRKHHFDTLGGSSAKRQPLNILFFGDLRDSDVRRYHDAMIKAVTGAGVDNLYVPDADDLPIQIDTIKAGVVKVVNVEKYFGDFNCILAVVAITHNLVELEGIEWFWQGLRLCYEQAVDVARCIVLPILIDERAREEYEKKCGADRNNRLFSRYQFLNAYALGEWAERSAMLALRTLHECRELLSEAFPDPERPRPLRFFISHAKMDGLPLAESVKHLIEDRLKWSKFYDATDIDPGADWRKTLKNGVKSSVLIALRTNNYDLREWCRHEIEWCELYARPAVCVDARTDLVFPPRGLPFEKYPVIRIADGNLLRVLFLAIREDLRFLLFDAQVRLLRESGTIPGALGEVEFVTFGCRPGSSALIHACEQLEGVRAKRKLIVYPDPPMERDAYEAAQALVEKYAADVELVTPDTLLADVEAMR